MPAEPAHRPIWLCADDYGISPSVNKAIRDLVMRGRLNATSVMVAAPSFDRSEAASLNMLNAGARRVAIGLHVTLTAPFQPMSAGFRPLRGGAFLPLDRDVRARRAARARWRTSSASEIATQLKAFVAAVRPGARFRRRASARASVSAGARCAARGGQGGGAAGLGAPVRRAWRRRPTALPTARRWCSICSAAGSASAPGSAASRPIRPSPAPTISPPEPCRIFPSCFRASSAGFRPHSVVMCHPGFVDAELTRLDPLTTQREREYAFFAGDAFPAVLRAHGVALA